MTLNLKQFNKKMQQLEEELVAKGINIEEVFISYDDPEAAEGEVLVSRIETHLEPTKYELQRYKELDEGKHKKEQEDLMNTKYIMLRY